MEQSLQPCTHKQSGKLLFDGKGEKFVAEMSKKFPGLESFLKGDKFEKFMPDIKDFCVEFASDSGNVPSC